MDIEERSVSCTADNVELIVTDEEIFALSSSSTAEAAFDAVIGCIEDIIMDDEFQQLEQSFKEKYYLEFADSDENKLIYTQIFNDYVDLLEKHIEQQLTERIPDFNMNVFIQHLKEHKEEVSSDIVDLLLTFTDFMAFKEMFLEYKAEKEGRGLGQALLVMPLLSMKP